MQEIRTSGSMSGDGKRSVAAWPKLPRPSSTLPKQEDIAAQQVVGYWKCCGPSAPLGRTTALVTPTRLQRPRPAGGGL
jgi:hypothetical protein